MILISRKKSSQDFVLENNMIFDTHIHLNDKKILSNLDQYLKEAFEMGVTHFMCIGWDLESSKKAIEIAEKYENVYCAIGVIPTEYKQYRTKDEINPTIAELEDLLKISRKIKAIGEIGLDYYREKEPEIKEKQKIMFKEQIELANKYHLPVSIHCRDAVQDTFDILKANKVENAGVMHCFSGSKEMAKEFVKLGYYIAFGGVLTFKNAVATKEVIANIPLERVVFETDAPYLAPVPFRGKINEPKYIFHTVKYASDLLNLDFESLQKISFHNSCELFHVKNHE